MNLTSLFALYGNLDPNNMHAPVTLFSNVWLRGLVEYGNAKFGLMVFTHRLAEILKSEKIYVFSVHPGSVQTDLMDLFTGIFRFLWTIFVKLYAKVRYFFLD